jgi:hypothetical protein
MADSRSRLPPIVGEARPEYRVVVTAAPRPGARGYMWAIVREDIGTVELRQASPPCRSMADAHELGVGALHRFRAEAGLSK